MKLKPLYLPLLLCVLLAACEDVFEKDLSSSQVVLRTPADGRELSSGSVDFWWNEVEGATQYRLQVVKGTFREAEALEADTGLSGNTYSLFLNSGEYQWQVTASNASSLTHSEIRSFSVDSTFSLEDEHVVLLSPPSGKCLGDTVLTIRWLAIPRPGIAYHVDIRKGDFNDNLDVFNYETQDTEVSAALPSSLEGSLSFGVRAVNDFGATPFSFRPFQLDLTAPSAAVLTAPADGDTLAAGDLTFRWNASADNGCRISDSLFIYSDSLLTGLKYWTGVAEGVNEATVNVEEGTWWWEVIRFDEAGNISSSSGIRKIHAEP